MFTQSEIGTLCYFFGLETTENVFDLSAAYQLEPHYIHHPSGDRLEAKEEKYVVTINGEELEFHEFPRNFSGLVEGLQLLTKEDA